MPIRGLTAALRTDGRSGLTEEYRGADFDMTEGHDHPWLQAAAATTQLGAFYYQNSINPAHRR